MGQFQSVNREMWVVIVYLKNLRPFDLLNLLISLL